MYTRKAAKNVKGKKLLRSGNSTASVKVFADVCMHCGERLYSQDIVHKFEHIRTKLAQQDTSEFVEVGKAYQIT